MSQIVYVLKGVPASSKSTWAKEEVSKNPLDWTIVNNDQLRLMCNGSVWSAEYEKIIGETRRSLIKIALQNGKNVIVDNVNADKKHWDEVINLVKKLNIDCVVQEKAFYVSLSEAIRRDAERTGTAKVGEEVIKKFWKKLGGEQFSFYKEKIEIFTKIPQSNVRTVDAPKYIDGADEILIVDLDGTAAICGDRNIYDASNCHLVDFPNRPVIETVMAHYKMGRKVIFVSGRDAQYEMSSRLFVEKHFIDNNAPIQYKMFLRSHNDIRKDFIVKEEIYRNHIEGQYNVCFVLDDRNSVVDFWRSVGLTCFQVAYGDF